MAGGFRAGGFALGKTAFPSPMIPGAGLDADVSAFATASGATDLTGLNNLVTYLKAQSLYNNFVIYPQKSAQNAGSGTTVYSLGGLTTNDMTLNGTPSPTWGPSGIAFNGTTQYGNITDFLGGSSTTAFFFRGNMNLDGANPAYYLAQYDFGASKRSLALSQSGSTANDGYQLNRSTNGTAIDSLQTQVAPSTGTDVCLSAYWPGGSTGATLWVNKTNQPLAAALPEVTNQFNTDVDVTQCAGLNSNTPAVFSGGTVVASAILQGTTLTTAQREEITDLINAL